MTSANTSGNNFNNPSITFDSDGYPVILYDYNSSSQHFIECSKFITSTSFTNIIIYNGGSYAQSNPCAIFVPQSINGLANGRICVAWHGQGASFSGNRIFYSYSDDGGLTWDTAINPIANSGANPSITVNKNNEIFIVYDGFVDTSYDDICMIKNVNNVWSVQIVIALGTTNHKRNPSTLLDMTLNFSEPLLIYKDMQNLKVGFYGTWTVGEGYTLTMENPVTLTDGQQVPIVDFTVKQAETDLTLSDIDTEKFSYEGTNLNTTTASIKVSGKDNKLNSLVYAVA
ncbi:hypothetical protein [Clostridium thailandense]|uniref:hypothetical protein n=1 Tax=Clostridium thailandense TaxID=2794346 RepID=UPI0039897E3A